MQTENIPTASPNSRSGDDDGYNAFDEALDRMAAGDRERRERGEPLPLWRQRALERQDAARDSEDEFGNGPEASGRAREWLANNGCVEVERSTEVGYPEDALEDCPLERAAEELDRKLAAPPPVRTQALAPLTAVRPRARARPRRRRETPRARARRGARRPGTCRAEPSDDDGPHDPDPPGGRQVDLARSAAL